MVDLTPVINPKGETVQISTADFVDGQPPMGYKLAPPTVSSTAQPPAVPEPPVPEGFTKVIKKETGEPMLLKNDDLVAASADIYSPFSKENLERSKRVQDNLKSLSDSPWYIPGSVDLAKSHAKDDIMTPDGKYKLQSSDGKPLDLSAAETVDALKDPRVKFRDPNAQELYEAQLLHLSTSGSRVASAGREAWPGLSAEDNAELSRQPMDFDHPNANTQAFNDDKLKIIADNVLGATKFSNERLLSKVLGTAAELYLSKGQGIYGEVGAAAKVEPAVEDFLAGNAPGAVRRVGAWAAGKAAGGITMASPQLIADGIVQQNPKLTAESVLMAGGLNVGLGLIGKGANALVSKFAETAEPIYMHNAIKELTGVSDAEIAKMGNPEQVKGFADALAERGLAKDASKASEVIGKMARGDDLMEAAIKMSPFVEKAPIDSMSLKLANIGEKASMIDKSGKIGETINQFSDVLRGLADKDGNVSLPKLLKFAQDTAEDVKVDAPTSDVVNEVRKQLHDEAMKEVISFGDKALTDGNVDVKTAAEWLQAKFNTQVAKQIDSGLMEKTTAVNSKSGMLEKAVKTLFKHKASALAAAGGAALGHATGIPGAGIAGGFLGHQVGHMAGHWAEAASSKIAEKIPGVAPFLKKNVGNSALSSYLTMASVHANAKQLEEIPMVLKALAVKNVSPTSDPVKAILGDSANGLSKQQQFNKLSDQLSLLQGSPQLKQEHIMQTVAPFAQAHPTLAAQMTDDLNTKIQFIHDIMPKDPNPPKPFTKNAKFEPSKADLNDFAGQLKIANNPYALLDGLKDGTVTAKQVAVAQQLNPAILMQIRAKLQDESTKHDLTYQQRLAAATIMGQSFEESMAKSQQLQSVYGPNSQANQPSGPPPKKSKGGTKGFNNPDKMPASQPTLSQRLLSK